MNRDIAFLFDLDGVLIDSESEYTRIWNEIERIYPTGIEDFALKIKGQTLTKILTDNYPDEEIQKSVNILLHELERKMTYRYCKGAEEFIDRLVEFDVPRAVVTSSDSVKMNHLFNDIPDFKEKFPVIIDASLVTRSKPDPEGYLLAASKLGVDPRKCAVFEDSTQGVKAGRKSGAFVVGIHGTKQLTDLAPYSDLITGNLSLIDIFGLCKVLEVR